MGPSAETNSRSDSGEAFIPSLLENARRRQKAPDFAAATALL